MNGNSIYPARNRSKRLFSEQDISLDAFKKLCSQETSSETYPLASSIEKNVPIYDLSKYALNTSASTISELQDEWYEILSTGPGVLILKGMYDVSIYGDVLDSTTSTFQRIIDHERLSPGVKKGDHFANSGANDRIWNSFSKHALADPESFVKYYDNPWLAHICEAWLGPAYRVTAQVNIVKPGGAPQQSHRDYHLGFQSGESCSRYPQNIQVASQLLTLQGAVAHTDMPFDSGPTRLLPFSQQFEPGFLAYRLPEFQAYFLSQWVTVSLNRGDGVFFNPALFHAAGENKTTDINRTANLLQISSAFGKPMESINTIPIVARCWDLLAAKYKDDGGLSLSLTYLIQTIADGYPFPTDLDHRPPAPSGMAPESEQEIIIRGLKDHWTRDQVVSELQTMKAGWEYPPLTG
ncbi:phytanoyl-CoA dioxygenase family protein [Talaromyces proteolyticus]|uniref:Phytanoyl-CoA dioxygenase family protein n=1 Tax=Talaromyces proteolyticus TaxID=1131652 RepID=A0AAD4PWV8_9EURO|nr:phytanoyl-CoA dioxygenase family protein [Talaromyces proteolyticus]KAH8692069.1 phytanoyl-CoA dioxygenase family protein [Talaromyces proteolyticus]